MALLTEDNYQQLEKLLISSKVLAEETLSKHRATAKTKGVSLIAELIDSKTINNEQLTSLTAKVTGVPYVNLTEAIIDNDTLSLLNRDIAERYMAIPLGLVQNKLAVAMIDAYNVQVVDFMTQKIGRPLKIYMASEEGIRHVLDQYPTDFDVNISAAVSSAASD